MKNFPMGKASASVVIGPQEVRKLYREVFNERGCIWTRITNDEINPEGWESGIYLTFLDDSTNEIKRPRRCWRIDTVMQINPITLEEDMVVMIDSLGTAKYDLGGITKKQLAEAINNHLGLAECGLNLRLKFLRLIVYNESCEGITVDYRLKETVQDALVAINNISTGSKVEIETFYLEDTNGRQFADGGLDKYDLAVMTIKD